MRMDGNIEQVRLDPEFVTLIDLASKRLSRPSRSSLKEVDLDNEDEPGTSKSQETQQIVTTEVKKPARKVSTLTDQV